MGLKLFLVFSLFVFAMANWETEVLKVHNQCRSKVALGKKDNIPSAKYMARMTWDKNLAGKAQKYANRCTFQNSITARGIGENLAASSNANSFTQMAQSWCDSISGNKIADYNNVSKAEIEAHGRFTQVVWYNSSRVGCGYKKCSGMEMLLCRYTGNANRVSHPIFETGPPCEKCDGKCTDGLCDGGIKGGVCTDKRKDCAKYSKRCAEKWVKEGCKKTCNDPAACDGPVALFAPPAPLNGSESVKMFGKLGILIWIFLMLFCREW